MAIFQGFQLFFISIIRWKNLGEWLGVGGGGGGASGCPNFLSRWKGRKKVIVRRTMYCIVLTMIQFIQKINKKCPKTFHLLRRPNLTRRGVSEVWQKVRSLSVCLWWYPLHIWDNSFLGNQKNIDCHLGRTRYFWDQIRSSWYACSVLFSKRLGWCILFPGQCGLSQ